MDYLSVRKNWDLSTDIIENGGVSNISLRGDEYDSVPLTERQAPQIVKRVGADNVGVNDVCSDTISEDEDVGEVVDAEMKFLCNENNPELNNQCDNMMVVVVMAMTLLGMVAAQQGSSAPPQQQQQQQQQQRQLPSPGGFSQAPPAAFQPRFPAAQQGFGVGSPFGQGAGFGGGSPFGSPFGGAPGFGGFGGGPAAGGALGLGQGQGQGFPGGFAGFRPGAAAGPGGAFGQGFPQGFAGFNQFRNF
ncbi:uncharacterized protein LOC126252402 [Schistocerca nitens]|uniref:uncharacterized protein LOC126252402 n=1 Tax=Schistocerca nitens TaxID=7011 RepID=UPI0021182DA6|nr:uncharacterized protein LOC126252402 [Schistocerca nitens]